MNREVVSQDVAEKVWAAELARAEERGADRARAELKADLEDLLERRTRVVRLGDHQIEIVEVSAFNLLLDQEG